VRRRTPLGGGCVSRVERLETSAGSFVLKYMLDAPPELFAAEAAGLHALGAAGSGLVIPRVVAASAGDDALAEPPLLVVEFLPAASPTSHTYEQVGRGLAELHRAMAPAFGFDRDTYCGATRQPNAWTPRWVAFYAAHRLGHQVTMARDAGRLSSGDRDVLDRMVRRLDRWLAEPAAPSLIHGDLWSGNLHITTGGAPALLDPAVYYAHREAEFGIMTLFGGFPARVYEAYDEVFPLEAGWRDRVPIYQLYHLLNHLNLFGAGYHTQTMAIARRFA
jgi:fructosamine-3-kinase